MHGYRLGGGHGFVVMVISEDSDSNNPGDPGQDHFASLKDVC